MFGNSELKKRIASLEKVIGATWYEPLERHAIYYTIDDENSGAMHNMYEFMKARTLENSKVLGKLLDYLKLTYVTHPQRTAIEKIKKGSK